MTKIRMDLLHCRTHDVWAIAVARLGDEDGSTRITHGKCCGSWTIERHWNVDATAAVNEIQCCAEE